MTDVGFRWDLPSGRFRWDPRCPYADCGADVPEVPEARVLGWCDRCDRPFEVEKLPVEGGGTEEVRHRPGTVYCARTGRRLVRLSVLDWCEAGGEPGRSGSVEDLRGQVFGIPGLHRTLTLHAAWTSPLGKGALLEQDDLVSSVSIVRGRVVAVTRRGTVGIIDAATGQTLVDKPLDWPGGTTHASDPKRSVRFPPAFRGTQGVIAAGHGAQFVDLQSYLFPRSGSGTRWTGVLPEEGKQFLGPPLGAHSERALFCLLEGSPNRASHAIDGAVLRFFAPDGEEEGRIEVNGIVRPPVLDRATGRVVWIDSAGGVHWTGPPGTDLVDGVSFPGLRLALVPTDRPLLLAAPNGSEETELWLASTDPAGEVSIHRALMKDVEAGAVDPWSWGSLEIGRLGELSGMAVGIGSRQQGNAVTRLMAISTDQQVQSMERTVTERPYRVAKSAPPSMGALLGSHDAPIVTSAGVLSRVQGSLVLDTQGLGWGDVECKVRVAGRYREAQGIAMLGRQIFIGRGLGVDSFVIGVDGSVPE